MDLVVKFFSFGYVSSVREHTDLKLICHLPVAWEGFPPGCVGGWQAEYAVAACLPLAHGRSGFVYRQRQLSGSVSGLQPLGLGERLRVGQGPGEGLHLLCCRACSFVSWLLHPAWAALPLII